MKVIEEVNYFAYGLRCAYYSSVCRDVYKTCIPVLSVWAKEVESASRVFESFLVSEYEIRFWDIETGNARQPFSFLHIVIKLFAG